mmetsp:Transcript_23099/g.58922  ORF Transcript_23099/g.58922 Transcript_23099/m.58922 type:complete len:302 (-) Transcript_23099:110-1015(-)
MSTIFISRGVSFVDPNFIDCRQRTISARSSRPELSSSNERNECRSISRMASRPWPCRVSRAIISAFSSSSCCSAAFSLRARIVWMMSAPIGANSAYSILPSALASHISMNSRTSFSERSSCAVESRARNSAESKYPFPSVSPSLKIDTSICSSSASLSSQLRLSTSRASYKSASASKRRSMFSSAPSNAASASAASALYLPATNASGCGSRPVFANIAEHSATWAFRRSAASSQTLRMGLPAGMRCFCVSSVYESFGVSPSSRGGRTRKVAFATISATGFVGCGLEKMTRNSCPCSARFLT